MSKCQNKFHILRTQNQMSKCQNGKMAKCQKMSKWQKMSKLLQCKYKIQYNFNEFKINTNCVR